MSVMSVENGYDSSMPAGWNLNKEPRKPAGFTMILSPAAAERRFSGPDTGNGTINVGRWRGLFESITPVKKDGTVIAYILFAPQAIFEKVELVRQARNDNGDITQEERNIYYNIGRAETFNPPNGFWPDLSIHASEVIEVVFLHELNENNPNSQT